MNSEAVRSTGALFELALEGDRDAWVELVDRLSPAVWGATRSFGLSEANAHDVFQTVWLRLLDRHETIRNPEALAGWLATTARNEARALVRHASRTQPMDEVPEFDDALVAMPEDLAEEDEVSGLVWAGFNELRAECQRLLRLLAVKVPYKDISELIDRPIGSIASIRKDCLAELRRTDHVAQIL